MSLKITAGRFATARSRRLSPGLYIHWHAGVISTPDKIKPKVQRKCKMAIAHAQMTFLSRAASTRVQDGHRQCTILLLTSDPKCK
eukprot:3332554-Alexandrium_andersonii.AAC.1